MVDAFTGAKLQEIITDDAINDPDVSGIAKINNWVANTLVDNTTQYVYGGDLGGNLWRFDLDCAARRSGWAGRRATAGDQPITGAARTRAHEGRAIGTYHRVVYFGTGRYLGLRRSRPDAPSTAVAQAHLRREGHGADLGSPHQRRRESRRADARLDRHSAHDPEPARRWTGREERLVS